MPAPTTINEFVELVQKSGVLDSKKLDAYLQKLRTAADAPSDVGKLAGRMVLDGLLTNFQAEQILQGRWKRFTIGKYKVLERLGSGGMGSVYLCEHKLMRRRVALKVLPHNKAEDSSSLERFYREARAVAALDHPNIVRAYDIDQEEKLHFLVMEYVDGASLQEMVKRGGPLDILRACHYVRQSAYGLQHAHETAGLVHRDIKPGNVLVDRSGVVKILDMGLARFFNDEDDILTKKYDENVLGTADYLAPEQALDSHGVDIRADVYSLGGTFYFCLTGRTPFAEGTVAQKLIWHQTRQPKPIKQLRPEVPDAVLAVIERMMAKDPAARYQTPAEVAAALEPLTQMPIGPPPEVEMPRLSPAATGNPPSAEMTPKTPPPSGGAVGGSASGGRAWTVANAPTKTPAGSGLRPPIPPAAAPPPAPAAAVTAPRPVTPAAAPRPAPAPKPAAAPAKNGQPPVPVSGPRPAGTAVTAAPPAPARDPLTAEDDAVPWDKLAPDTDPAGRRADTSPRSGRPRSRSGTRTAPDAPRIIPLWVILAAAAGLVLLFVGAGLLWLVLGVLFKATPTGASGQPNVLIVNAQKPGAFRTVSDAVAMAKPGQTVVIEEDRITEQLTLDNGGDRKLGLGVTVTAAPGQTVTWQAPDKVAAGAGGWFIKLANVSGLQLKRITFDGEGKLSDLMLLTGTNPDLLLEDVTFQGFKQTGVTVANASGSEGHSVTFQRVTIASGAKKAKHALLFSVNPKMMPAPNRYFTFRDLTLEGDFEEPIKVLDQEVRTVTVLGTWKKPGGNPTSFRELPKPAPPPPPPAAAPKGKGQK